MGDWFRGVMWERLAFSVGVAEVMVSGDGGGEGLVGGGEGPCCVDGLLRGLWSCRRRGGNRC